MRIVARNFGLAGVWGMVRGESTLLRQRHQRGTITMWRTQSSDSPTDVDMRGER